MYNDVCHFHTHKLTMADFLFFTLGKIYYLDPHCDDLIIFPPEFKQTLQQHPLNRDGVIVVQVR